ncbi:MAG: nicotinate-nucleotide adenylyltransferase [Ruminococcaceae bacterium]|nr:nicotinate-nucleotide adenylyltransferase [Oscillospiraceae bacterium]
MRTGIFGGTFDPIHNGHLLSAIAIKEILGFDRILFIPTGEPPHKIARNITSAADRLAMVKCAIEGKAGFEVSDIEVERKNYTYTYDTLVELQKNAQQDEEFSMIIGADTLADVFNWHRSEDVFKLCSFVAMQRPGTQNESFALNLEKARNAGAKVETVEIPQYDISSTNIRTAIAKGEDVSEYIPKPVNEYIKEKNIYTNRAKSYNEICEDLKRLLSPKRFAHCEGVAEECVRIAKLFGADIEKCRLAGILHDCAKELTEKQYMWMGFDANADNGYDGECVLLHAEAGAVLAKDRYGIKDEEILEAVRCHITGKPEMSIISQILFLADYTEKSRVGECYDAVREKIDKGLLYEAMLAECDNALIYNLKKDKMLICTQTVKTRNWIVKMLRADGQI